MIKIPQWNTAVQAAAQELYENIVRRTPVRSGTLAAGWSINTTENAVSISNPVPYAGYVENGTTKQAPSYMVKTSLEELPEILERKFREQER